MYVIASVTRPGHGKEPCFNQAGRGRRNKTRRRIAKSGLHDGDMRSNGCATKETEHLYELEAVFANTEKHVVWALPEAHTAKVAIAMATAVAGGVEELKKRPLLSCYSESISPLAFSTMNEDLVEFATAGLPVFFTGCPMVGLTGPATLIGTYTLGNAKTLAALTLSQLINPGTPFIYGPGIRVSDLRTLRFSFAAPEWAMGHIIQSQLARFYKLNSNYAEGEAKDALRLEVIMRAAAKNPTLMRLLKENVPDLEGDRYSHNGPFMAP